VKLIISGSGMLLPHQGEILRALNPTVSTHDAGSGQASLPQAVEMIKNAHPDEPVLSARWDTDVVEVRTEQATYAVEPSTGHETSRATANPAWVSVLDNLHRCLLSCRGPGHVSWMSQEIPHTGWRGGHRGLTVGGLVVATLGVVLAVLTVSGLRTWWPLQRHRRTALSARRRTQRLSRDTDLLKAAGLVLLPLLFLWGYYASAFSIRPTQPAAPASMTAHQSPAGSTSTGQAQDIGPHRAVAAGNAHETNELPHPVIDVNHVVAGLKLADFLEGERHFCVSRVVGTQIVFVEAVEDLMICVERGADRLVAETFVQREVDGGEKRAFGSLTGGLHQLGEDVAQTLLLLLAVGQDESALTVGEIFDKGVQHLLKVLVEQGLGLGVEDNSRHLLAAGGRLCAGTAHPLPENASF